jgi:hypothetical protein
MINGEEYNIEDDQDFVDDDVEIVEDEENELFFSVEGLGQFHEIEGQKLFVKTDDCVHCIHDIQVALRKDNMDEKRRVDRLLGGWQTVEKRLVPLFLHYREESKIWSGVLKLLVILTRPLTRQVEDMPVHLKHLQDYKAALTSQDVFITLMSILMDAMSVNERTETQINEIETQIARIEAQPIRIEPVAPEVNPQETQELVDEKVMELRKEEAEKQAKKERKRKKEQKLAEIRSLAEQSKVHEKNVELVLTLIRHLLEIPDPKVGDMAYSQDRGQLQIVLIKHLSDEGVLDLLVMYAEHAVDQPKLKHLNWLFFEIFYHICATIPPSELANYDHLFKRDLSKLLDVEKRLVYAQVPQYSRHSRFASASVLRNVAPRTAAAAPTVMETQKAARGRHYRERRIVANPDDPTQQQVNLFQDPSFIDINTGEEMLPSSILGKDYRDFYADIKTFVEQWTDSVFGKLMTAVYAEIEQDSKNLHEYDTVRVLNMIAWMLDYQCKLFKKQKKAGEAPLDLRTQSVDWAITQDAINLVSRQLKQHSKEAKTIKHGGANLIVTLRALLEQLRFAKLLGPKSAGAFTIMDSFCYDEVNRLLSWTIRSYKPTANRLEVLSFALQCVDEFLRLTDAFEKHLAKADSGQPAKVKKRKPKISQAEAEFQGMDMYDQGCSDSDVSIQTSSDDENDSGMFLESVRDAKAALMADMCHSEAIKHLFHALNLFKDMTTATNTAVAAILMRITQEHDTYVAYFFQLSNLVVLHNIVSDPTLRSVEEERIKYDSVILISKLIIRKFIKAARLNRLVFIEALFPRSRGGRGGSLLSVEADLNAICSNYADEESRFVLERIHNGDSYETLKAEKREQTKYAQPWTEDEDQQLVGLWTHVKDMEGRSWKDKINSVVFNMRPSEGRRKRKFKDVRLRLVSLGLLDPNSEEMSDYSEEYSSDDDYRPNYSGDDRSPRARSDDGNEDLNANQMNFNEYVKRVNAVKVSEVLSSMFESILSANEALTMDEKQLLGI